MRWRINSLELAGPEGTPQRHEVSSGERLPTGHTAATLGLSLEEGKVVLAAVQRHLVTAQVDEHCCSRRRCDRCGAQRPLQDRRPLAPGLAVRRWRRVLPASVHAGAVSPASGRSRLWRRSCPTVARRSMSALLPPWAPRCLTDVPWRCWRRSSPWGCPCGRDHAAADPAGWRPARQCAALAPPSTTRCGTRGGLDRARH